MITPQLSAIRRRTVRWVRLHVTTSPASGLQPWRARRRPAVIYVYVTTSGRRYRADQAIDGAALFPRGR